jgi:hypothetical protein
VGAVQLTYLLGLKITITFYAAMVDWLWVAGPGPLNGQHGTAKCTLAQGRLARAQRLVDSYETALCNSTMAPVELLELR